MYMQCNTSNLCVLAFKVQWSVEYVDIGKSESNFETHLKESESRVPIYTILNITQVEFGIKHDCHEHTTKS